MTIGSVAVFPFSRAVILALAAHPFAACAAEQQEIIHHRHTEIRLRAVDRYDAHFVARAIALEAREEIGVLHVVHHTQVRRVLGRVCLVLGHRLGIVSIAAKHTCIVQHVSTAQRAHVAHLLVRGLCFQRQLHALVGERQATEVIDRTLPAGGDILVDRRHLRKIEHGSGLFGHALLQLLCVRGNGQQEQQEAADRS
jgi:hypothetical protein